MSCINILFSFLFTAFVLEALVHFLSEKRTEPYIWYGDGSIAGEKCARDQEAGGSYAPHKSRSAGTKVGLAVDITKFLVKTYDFFAGCWQKFISQLW